MGLSPTGTDQRASAAEPSSSPSSTEPTRNTGVLVASPITARLIAVIQRLGMISRARSQRSAAVEAAGNRAKLIRAIVPRRRPMVLTSSPKVSAPASGIGA
jgi:hypothetical protein